MWTADSCQQESPLLSSSVRLKTLFCFSDVQVRIHNTGASASGWIVKPGKVPPQFSNTCNTGGGEGGHFFFLVCLLSYFNEGLVWVATCLEATLGRFSFCSPSSETFWAGGSGFLAHVVECDVSMFRLLPLWALQSLQRPEKCLSHPHSELDVVVQVGDERFEGLPPSCPGVVLISLPWLGDVPVANVLLPLGVCWDTGEPMAQPCFCLQYFPLYGKMAVLRQRS